MPGRCPLLRSPRFRRQKEGWPPRFRCQDGGSTLHHLRSTRIRRQEGRPTIQHLRPPRIRRQEGDLSTTFVPLEFDARKRDRHLCSTRFRCQDSGSTLHHLRTPRIRRQEGTYPPLSYPSNSTTGGGSIFVPLEFDARRGGNPPPSISTSGGPTLLDHVFDSQEGD